MDFLTKRTIALCLSLFCLAASAGTVEYGIPTPNEVKQTIDRILRYVDAATPAALVDSRSLREITDYDEIDEHSRIKTGQFKMVCYEWGVTYSAMLAAWQATGDTKYMDYLRSRLLFLKAVSPNMDKVRRQRKAIDPQMRRFLDPHSLDDSGALCCAMMKAMDSDSTLHLEKQVERLAHCVTNRQKTLADGTFCRSFPQRNSVWLDDMFMGIPTLAWMGRYTGDASYYDKATKMIRLFRKHSFVEEQKLFRHGWVEDMVPHRLFPWGRANGWALLTLCEVLDILPANHSDREELLDLLRKHIDGIASCQGLNGFWHQLLDRQDSFEETSATAIFTYCLAHAINKGWINAKAYGPQALLGWQAVASAVNGQGQVEGVCVGTGMGFDPMFYQLRKTDVAAAHGYGTAIWAGSEIIRLLNTQHPKTNDGAVEFYDEEIKANGAVFHVK